MPTYKAPVEDVKFLLNDVLDIERYSNLPGFSDAPPDVIAAILEEGAKFCEGVLQPLNNVGDEEGCKRNDDGSVTTPTGFKEAYALDRRRLARHLGADRVRRAGPAATLAMASTRWSRQRTWRSACIRASPTARTKPSSTTAATSRRRLICRSWSTGEWTGTMNLTEPHCGTDLGMLRTKADPASRRQLPHHRPEDFHLRRRARSRGEHHPSRDRAHRRRAGGHEGHLALHRAEIPGQRRRLDSGKRNGVVCGKIEEKMGIHGNSTCVLNYDDAIGYLVGAGEQGPRTPCSR